jgi:hypothetical protein
VPADGTRAATVEKRRLRYVAAFVGQLSDKPLLARSIYVGCRNVKHNGGPRNYALIRFDDGVVSVVVQVSDFIQTALDYRT